MSQPSVSHVTATSCRPEAGLDVVVGPGRVVSVCGDLDAASASTLTDALAPLVDQAGVICVDIAGLEFIDAAGIKVFCTAVHALGERGRIAVLNPSQTVRGVFDIVQLAHLLSEPELEPTTAS